MREFLIWNLEICQRRVRKVKEFNPTNASTNVLANASDNSQPTVG